MQRKCDEGLVGAFKVATRSKTLARARTRRLVIDFSAVEVVNSAHGRQGSGKRPPAPEVFTGPATIDVSAIVS